MNFERVKRSYLKRNIIIVMIVICVISAIILNFTKAKYRVTQSIPLVNGTINYSPGDIIISAYFNDELLDTFPTKESGYSVENVVCDKNATATFNESAWEIEVNNFTQKNTKCDVHFIEKVSAKDTILANYPTVLTRTNFSSIVTNTTTGTIYKSVNSSQYDNDGEVYYFAGNPTDNWVKFGGFYWRIIRINGDGTIRVIYQGTNASTTGIATQIQTSTFNSSGYNNMHVGYMYTSNQVHGLGTSSTIKSVIDKWYSNKLSNYVNSIDGNVGFCGDRTPSTSSSSINNSGGTGTTETYYGAYVRLYGNAKNPTFKCTNNSDLYTTSGNNNGNKALSNPIGLISMDEVWYAGGYISSNGSYYLYTGQNYWTMSPYLYSMGDAGVFYVSSAGSLSNNNFVYWSESGVRPVINLKADVTISGSGTATNPYVIEGAE